MHKLKDPKEKEGCHVVSVFLDELDPSIFVDSDPIKSLVSVHN